MSTQRRTPHHRSGRNASGAESDWVDRPEEFGPVSSDHTTAEEPTTWRRHTERRARRPRDAEPDVGGEDEAEPDRVEAIADGNRPSSVSDVEIRTRFAEVFLAELGGGSDGDIRTRFAEAFLADLESEPDGEISTRFAEAFLAELGADPEPSADLGSTVDPEYVEFADRLIEDEHRGNPFATAPPATTGDWPSTAGGSSFEEQLRRAMRDAPPVGNDRE